MKHYMLLALVAGCHAFFQPGAPPPPEQFDDPGSLFADDEVEEYEPVTTTSPAVQETSQKCGIRKDHPLFRAATLNNTKARYAEFNWVVPIFEVMWNGVENYTCVGSLIHPRVVLSVAHYFVTKRNWLIRAGDWNIDENNEFFKHQSIYVATVEKHPKFNAKLRFDAALLFLVSPVTPNQHVGFACLPHSNSVTLPGSACIVTGWGVDSFKDGHISDIMKMSKVPAVSDADCQETLRARLGQAFNLHKSWMCAGGRIGEDACLKDGGAPLVCPYTNSATANQYYQAGIVSWGYNCGLDGVPGVYTKVAEVRQWIDDQMVANGYDTVSYTA
ncbi:hypothetical protein ABMA27_012763 [Loxostege sticticalis]|uniref:Peptidase S1 domain-containing protein n=1 Tax=Loxostege sticticalis TaxID=481309 RepID=A0ABR3GZR1_LOXSC